MASIIFTEKAKIYFLPVTKSSIANNVKLMGNQQYKVVAGSVVKSNTEDTGNLLNCVKESTVKKIIQSV